MQTPNSDDDERAITKAREKAERKAKRAKTYARKQLIDSAIVEYNDKAPYAKRISLEVVFRSDGVHKAIWEKYSGGTTFPSKDLLVEEVRRFVDGTFIPRRGKRKAEITLKGSSATKRQQRDSPAAAAATTIVAAAAAAAGPRSAFSEMQDDMMTEDEAIRRAIQLSLQKQTPTTTSELAVAAAEPFYMLISDDSDDEKTQPADSGTTAAAAATETTTATKTCFVCLEVANGMIPLLGQGSGCDHMICDGCLTGMIESFANGSAELLECNQCKKAGKLLARPYTFADNMFLVHPSLIMNSVGVEITTKIRDRKKKFLDRFTTPIGQPVKLTCPACDEYRPTAIGPCTIDHPNLAICTSCFAVSCCRCGKVTDHANDECPATVKDPLPPFKPYVGRLCPRAACKNNTPVIHTRGDGCHLMNCVDCGQTFCYVCGMPSLGSKHMIDRKQCTCPAFCTPECPCMTHREIDDAQRVFWV